MINAKRAGIAALLAVGIGTATHYLTKEEELFPPGLKTELVSLSKEAAGYCNREAGQSPDIKNYNATVAEKDQLLKQYNFKPSCVEFTCRQYTNGHVFGNVVNEHYCKYN